MSDQVIQKLKKTRTSKKYLRHSLRSWKWIMTMSKKL